MTEDGARAPGPPDGQYCAGLAWAILSPFASMAVVYLLFQGYPAVFDRLGMDALPWLTEFFITLIRGFRTWWWAAGIVCAVLAVLAWNGRLGAPGRKPIVILLVIAVLLPGLAYVAMHMPVVDLQKKLGGS